MALWAVRVEGGFGSYRRFTYTTMLLMREASWLPYCIVGHPYPASAPSLLLVLLEPHCNPLCSCILSPHKIDSYSHKGRYSHTEKHELLVIDLPPQPGINQVFGLLSHYTFLSPMNIYFFIFTLNGKQSYT